MERKSRVFENVSTRTIDVAYAICLVYIIVSYLSEVALGVMIMMSGASYAETMEIAGGLLGDADVSGFFNVSGILVIVYATFWLVIKIVFARLLLGLFYDVKIMRYQAEGSMERSVRPAMPPVKPTSGNYYGNRPNNYPGGF